MGGTGRIRKIGGFSGSEDDSTFCNEIGYTSMFQQPNLFVASGVCRINVFW